MSRALDFTLVGVITVIATVIHRMSVELFAPGSVLYDIATDGTGNLNGTARAALWFEILSVWMPIIAIAGISVWALVREYRRQIQTASRARP